MRRRRRIALLMCFVMLLYSANLPAVMGAQGSLSDSSEELYPLNNIVFRTSTGDLTISPVLATVVTGVYEATAFTLADPRPLGQTRFIRRQGVDSRVNQNVLAAILMYTEMFSIEQIRQNTGLNVTETQVLSAVQLALWRQALQGYRDFQIQEVSIRDGTVRSLSTAIETWATTQVRNLPVNQSITSFILPSASPRLNTNNATMQISDINIMYGPYTFTSNPATTLNVNFSAGFIVDSAGQRLERVTSGQQFFVVLPSDFTGTTTINLSGRSRSLDFMHSNNRVWLSQSFNPINLRFNVSTAMGSSGLVDFTLFDSFTRMPVPNVEILIRTATTNVTVLTTSSIGSAQHELPVGDYIAEITTPGGWIPPAPVPFTIGFIGDVQTLNIPIYRTEGIMNFYAVNSTTLASAGYSQAFVFRDGEPIRRLAFHDGECLGIAFEPGEYIISLYLTTGGYSISGPIPFTVQAGSISDLTIPLSPNTPETTIRVADTMNRNNWVFRFYRGSEFLFQVNNNGMQRLRLPPLEQYQVIARTNDNTFVLPMFNFQVPNHDSEVVIPVPLGTETVSFQFVDTVVGEPIPNVIAGLFDQNHRLLRYATANSSGFVTFENVRFGHVYFVNILGAPPSVSGYSANGNRFLGASRHFTVQLYSQEQIRRYTSLDTIWRLPNVVWQGPVYVYPRITVPELGTG